MKDQVAKRKNELEAKDTWQQKVGTPLRMREEKVKKNPTINGMTTLFKIVEVGKRGVVCV